MGYDRPGNSSHLCLPSKRIRAPSDHASCWARHNSSHLDERAVKSRCIVSIMLPQSLLLRCPSGVAIQTGVIGRHLRC